MSVLDGQYADVQRREETLRQEDSKLRHEKVLQSSLTLVHVYTCIHPCQVEEKGASQPCMYVH